MADYPPEPRPDRRCGACDERLVWRNGYTHAGPMMDRHGAWPVEDYDENDEESERWRRWDAWRPQAWTYAPLPGVIVNPKPPEPPVGTKLAPAHDPGYLLWENVGNGQWKSPNEPPEAVHAWGFVADASGPLVLFEETPDV